MHLRHELIIARKYVRPAMIRGVWTNPAWRTDNSRSLWEVIESSPGADAALQTTLEPGWILITPARSGVFLEHVEVERDEDGRPELEERFLLHAGLVLRVVPWTLGGEMPTVMGSRVLVAPDDPRQEKTTGLIIRPDVIEKRPVTGRVVGLGSDVEEDIAEGDRVLYSLYAGTDLEVNGERRTIMEASQVLAKIHEDETVEVA